MTTKFNITKCQPNHLDVLMDISKRTFIEAFEKDNDPLDFKNYIDTAFSRETLRCELSNLNTQFYFVFQGETMVGYFKINVGEAQTDVKLGHSMELERIYILSTHQGLGLGGILLAKVKEMAIQQDKTLLWLGVWEKNERAIQFYQRQGFQKFGTHPYYIGSDKQTDWLMRFDLSILLA